VHVNGALGKLERGVERNKAGAEGYPKLLEQQAISSDSSI